MISRPLAEEPHLIVNYGKYHFGWETLGDGVKGQGISPVGNQFGVTFCLLGNDIFLSKEVL